MILQFPPQDGVTKGLPYQTHPYTTKNLRNPQVAIDALSPLYSYEIAQLNKPERLLRQSYSY